MGSISTTYKNCPRCGGVSTFECWEALSSCMKGDDCSKCRYSVKYDVDDSTNHIKITKTGETPSGIKDDQFTPLTKEERVWRFIHHKHKGKKILVIIKGGTK